MGSDKNGLDSGLIQGAKTGDRQALARLLTAIERSHPATVLSVPELLSPPRPTFRFGITGPPGAGKSTLVAQLLLGLRKLDFNIAVLAVDPSSPFSQGAILGDRIRYVDHVLDPKVFIRSVGTRGSLGGLSGSSFLMARAFDLCNFDCVLIETVGVGQTELDVLQLADRVSVVLVPESGDSIQAMKAGLMEIADVFVVNKSDRPGADTLAREIQAASDDGGSENKPPVFMTVASQNKGVDSVINWVVAQKCHSSWVQERQRPERLQSEGRALLRFVFEAEILQRSKSIQNTQDLLKELSTTHFERN